MTRIVRSARTIATASAVAIVLAIGIGALATRSSRSFSLSLAGDGYNYCYKPPTNASRQAAADGGVIFGLDAVRLPSESAHVVVTSVRMIRPSGGVQLAQAAFVPNAEVAIGTPGDKGIQTSTHVLASMAQYLPAALSSTTKPTSETGTFDPRMWQLAVKVRLPTASTTAHIGGFEIHYRSGSATKTLVTRDTVTLVSGSSSCTAPAT